MTLQQIQLVTLTASLGSISAAAKQLDLYQPNASQSIKKLEEELGYSIFERDGGHTIPTEQGYLFLEHAETIIRENEAIRALTEYTDSTRLRIGVINYTPAVEAFLRFIKEKQDMPFCNLSCVNVSPDKAPDLLRKHELDIIVTPQPESTLSETQQMCKVNRLSYTIHKELPICVRLRADHPLIISGKLDGSRESFAYLKAYPYAEYRSMDNFTHLLQPNRTVPFGYSYKIYADERDTRLKILRNSNAYNIGVQLPDWKLAEYGLKSFQIGEHVLLCSYIRKGDDELKDIVRYRELLMMESGWFE